MQNISDVYNILDKTVINLHHTSCNVNTLNVDIQMIKEAANESNDAIEFMNNLFKKFKVCLPLQLQYNSNNNRWSKKWQ